MNYSTSTILQALNKNRADKGLAPLKFNPNLSQIAQKKADDMIARQYFSHTSPDGKLFRSFLDDSKMPYIYAGENLAKDYPDTDSMSRAWMDSPTHKANILSSKYTDLGIGIKNGHVVTFFMAGTPSPNKAETKPKSTSTPQMKTQTPMMKPMKSEQMKSNRPIQSRNPMKYVA